MSFEYQLEREIEAIENDDTISNEEKNKLINELLREARAIRREEREREDSEREGY